MRTSLFWYTKDLRLEDLPGLMDASRQSDVVVPVYIWDDGYLEEEAPNRLAFLKDCLLDLANELSAIGSTLTIRRGNTVSELLRLCSDTAASIVYCSQSRDPQTAQLQRSASQALAEHGIAFNQSQGNYLIDPDTIRTRSGTIYQVFTPFSKQVFDCLQRFKWTKQTVSQEGLTRSNHDSIDLHTIAISNTSSKRQSGGLKQGSEQWDSFQKYRLARYDRTRDVLADEEGTSRISAHLNFGTVSIHAILREIIKEDSQGARSYINELIWREFNYYLALHFPHMLYSAFKQEYNLAEWKGDMRYLEQWQKGQTGFPIVDAAMRELKETGWMHNRARMIVASFLVKDLLINWQSGEEYFMQWLTDGDRVQNNAGWQWSASTGADAQPYFRIFNPASQGKKFDPDGAYVKRWVPELSDVPSKYIHEPTLWDRAVKGYPSPIVDHAAQRLKAISMFKEARMKYEAR